MQSVTKKIEAQMNEYAKNFLKAEYGAEAQKKFESYIIKAVNSYDNGGVSEVTGNEVIIAAKRDIDQGRLTSETKLTIRHELGHILDENSPDCPEFDEIIAHEKIAWDNAKLKTPAEHWYKNLAVRTHMDPLKMQVLGYPNPETKVPKKLLQKGKESEMKRMSKNSVFVDEVLAERFAMANLTENSSYYST
ncbi:MAG: hypothetical protein ACQCN5_13025 [Candidatus Bathyarchaeia archaeon]